MFETDMAFDDAIRRAVLFNSSLASLLSKDPFSTGELGSTAIGKGSAEEGLYQIRRREES